MTTAARGRPSAEERIRGRERAFIASAAADREGELPAGDVARFRRIVRDYYRCCGRDLVWRRDREPYHILVSEVMLQQTQVPRVSVKYPAFVARFPDFRALASAPLAEVLEEWQGLGYNRRALQLKQAAEEVVTRFRGKMPADLAAVDSLPGVGHATAAAVMAMSFGVPVPYIETNVRAVYLHFFFGDRCDVPDSALAPFVERTIDRRDPRSWYYALMDYGTWLKKREVNPCRRSRHHAVGTPFRGSSREVRGSVLRELVRRGRASAEELVEASRLPEADVARALQAFERERLAVRDGTEWRVG